MAENNLNQQSPTSDSLHPVVNMAIIGLVSMFVAAVWIFFDSDPYGAWLDVVVTSLFVVAIAIPPICWQTWRRNADAAKGADLAIGLQPNSTRGLVPSKGRTRPPRSTLPSPTRS